MYIFFSILIIVACVFLTLVVLIQNPKGGGIASNFSSPNQIMGARRTNDVIEKTTWILAVVLISFSLISNFFRPYGEADVQGAESRLKSNIENAEAAPAMTPPPAPTPAPENVPADEAAPATPEPAK
jgi:preprotein translocase subunit SecG